MITCPYQGKSPKIDPTARIAENAVIIGDVEIGPRVNVWYNCVIRGDLNRIVIGAETNVQDGTIIHVESDDGPCVIGKRVTIGHAAIVHGCQVGDNALIGMGATVLSWAKLGAGCLIGANALVKEHAIIPPRTMWAGVPAKQRGDVTDEMFSRMSEGCDHYLHLAAEYRNLDS